MTKKKAAKRKPAKKKTTAKKPAKMGRPKAVVNWRQVDELCSMLCTQDEICRVIGMNRATLLRHCKAEKGCTFAAYYEQKSVDGDICIRRSWRKLIDSCHPATVIFSMKNRFGWSDKIEQQVTEVDSGVYELRLTDTTSTTGGE